MTNTPPTLPEIKEYPLFSRGKVRDVYDLGNNLLIVASDRLSAYDVVLPTPIPGKGAILTQLSIFWFKLLGIPNHFLTDDVSEYPSVLHKYENLLRNRSMLVKKAKRFDLECVARGYLVGSGWADYKASGSVCGHKLPKGLTMGQELPTPLFTPAFKNDKGHDENISLEQAISLFGEKKIAELQDLTLGLYQKAQSYAREKGVIIADTKFEFGEVDGQIILIDEALTPDSSRFWPAQDYRPGQEQPSYDKQFIRDYLSTLAWDKTPPGPQIPQEIVDKTLNKYLEAFEKLTGKAYK